ncbi:chemotaxis protein CheW [Roseateles sp. BYS180W]|uniref:Chemotaxis protein CheW n=1 Tax=Roseateles rivi TaxID=3299028 RepID=A0ABW7FU60_9BURK
MEPADLHQSSPPGATRQLLRLSVAHEAMLVPIDAVREILELVRLTPLPQSPGFIAGVMNLRGAVVPVIDVGHRMGLGPIATSKRTAIVVVEVKGDEEHDKLITGVLVDAVYEVLEVDTRHIEPVPQLGLPIPAEFIAGMVNLQQRYAALLSLDQVLSPALLTRLIGEPA